MEILNGKRFVLGTCYYPEHWKEEVWKEDLERMLATGIEVIRVAEFAWSKIEPTEGNFTYEFFDHFLDVVEETQMKVIFCTPSATPPAWLTDKYPEVLNVSKEGLVYRHGQRRHYNYNSSVYQEFCARITEKSAARYAGRKCIIGWQIDNEINCEKNEFYSESDTVAFRKFLQDKYGTLDKLNDAWGTVFWNQTYTAWEEIYVPRPTYADSTNPHEVLDYTRFVSASARGFAKLQSDILRKYIKPGDFITTNGIFENLDNHAMTEESLDFITYDSYPNFAYMVHTYDEADDMRDRKWSRNLAEVRSISPIFGIMEQQSGANGWNTRMAAPTPRPGQLTLWTMQSIAHGADFVSYFRWRTCTFGTEIYWHGILDYSGRENRRIREVKQVYKRLQNIKEVSGSYYEATVGILCDYDNLWDANLDVWHNSVEKVSKNALFQAMQHNHTPFDYVYLTEGKGAEDLQKYKVLFYPHATIMSEERVRLLEEYVAEGGILVVGCRSGYKDMHGKCVTTHLPGLLADVTGTDIPEYSFIAPDAGDVTIDWAGTQMKAQVFADLLEPLSQNACVEAVYTSDYYAGSGALISHPYKQGKAYYYGTAFDEQAAGVFLQKLGAAEPYKNILTLPETCEIAVRVKEDRRYMFILNYSKEPADIVFLQEVVNLESKEAVCGNKVLEGYGVMVVSLEEKV